jgi:hypothetical protein
MVEPIRPPSDTPVPASPAPPPSRPAPLTVANTAALTPAGDGRPADAPPPARSPGTVCAPPGSAIAAAVAAVVGSDTPAPPQICPKLVVIRGQKIGQEYPVYEGRNAIGRFADRPVDIDLNGQEAEGQVWSSRQHAAVTFGKGVLLVEDLNSLNGTWLNGNRIHPGQQRVLKPGDVIQIGTVQLKVAVG